jgi:hypothetical protein
MPASFPALVFFGKTVKSAQFAQTPKAGGSDHAKPVRRLCKMVRLIRLSK